MRYPNIIKASFISRENRFVATVRLHGEKTKVHVKNTGRCRELLVPGANVYLVDSGRPERKYRYDLVAVEKGSLLVNMDSQAPNQVFGEFLSAGCLIGGVTRIKPEYRYRDSRVDFYFERGGERHLVEVKGVTLEEDGLCRFPDAPTQRGTKHLRELTAALEEGFRSWICFVVQMEGMRALAPNWRTDPEFSEALCRAARAGVRVRAFGCCVGLQSLEIAGELPVLLEVQDSKVSNCAIFATNRTKNR